MGKADKTKEEELKKLKRERVSLNGKILRRTQTMNILRSEKRHFEELLAGVEQKIAEIERNEK